MVLLPDKYDAMKKRKPILTIGQFIRFLMEWNEIWSIPAAFLIFWTAPKVFRHFDPTAGSFDLGQLQRPTLALVFLLIYSGLSWLGTYFNFPSIQTYINKNFEKDFTTLTAWQKICLSLFVPCYYLLLFVLLTIVI